MMQQHPALRARPVRLLPGRGLRPPDANRRRRRLQPRALASEPERLDTCHLIASCDAPDGVAIHEGLVYVADTCNHRGECSIIARRSRACGSGRPEVGLV